MSPLFFVHHIAGLAREIHNFIRLSGKEACDNFQMIIFMKCKLLFALLVLIHLVQAQEKTSPPISFL